jgi:transcriptional regulator with XRE-family HTH domain
VGIGEALARARHQAGLTLAEVSQRTRIREALIRDIENDDYSACGGDFYARGHIRAMAKAAGADPEPLIREFDATRQMPQALTLADIFLDTPATPATPGTAAATRERQRPNKTQALAAAVLAAFLVALAFAAYGLLSGSRHAVTAAPRAGGQPTAQYALGPNRRAGAAVPASPPVQLRAETPVNAAAAGPYHGQRTNSQARTAGDQPRSHRSQASQLADHRPLPEPASGHPRGPGLRPPAGHTRADQPRQRFRHGDPGPRRPGAHPGRPAADRPHRTRGAAAAAAHHTTPRRLSAQMTAITSVSRMRPTWCSPIVTAQRGCLLSTSGISGSSGRCGERTISRCCLTTCEEVQRSAVGAFSDEVKQVTRRGPG